MDRIMSSGTQGAPGTTGSHQTNDPVVPGAPTRQDLNHLIKLLR